MSPPLGPTRVYADGASLIWTETAQTQATGWSLLSLPVVRLRLKHPRDDGEEATEPDNGWTRRRLAAEQQPEHPDADRQQQQQNRPGRHPVAFRLCEERGASHGRAAVRARITVGRKRLAALWAGRRRHGRGVWAKALAVHRG
jgi:hypothetical protein